ncbi:MAG: hypothetical protein M0Z94_20780 [Dehalococcoidales bacterium]|nr:hypothetical protein [Dehalococcoidales bacterium]
MRRFELLQIRHNVEITPGKIKNSVALTRHPGEAVVTYSPALPANQRNVGVAMMFGVLEKRWSGTYFLFRFPEEGDPDQLIRALVQARRDYRPVFRWAAELLITDRMLREIEREERSPWELVEQEQVTPELVAYRLGVLPPLVAASC